MKSARSIGKKRWSRRSAGNLNACEMDSLMASETAWRIGTRCSRIPKTLACGIEDARSEGGYEFDRRASLCYFGHCIQKATAGQAGHRRRETAGFRESLRRAEAPRRPPLPACDTP